MLYEVITLASAEFDLESTVIRAPTDGFITQLRLRPGMMAVPMPFAPLMTFVHSDEPIFVAGFSQQPMQNVITSYSIHYTKLYDVPGQDFSGDNYLLEQVSGRETGFSQMADYGRWGFFMNGSYGFGDKDMTAMEPGFEFDSWSLTTGVSYNFV